jgi:hypothetical protein
VSTELLEQDFRRAQRRAKIRNTLLLVGLAASLAITFALMLGAIGSTGIGRSYVLAPLPLLACYGIVRTFFGKR